MLPGKKKKLVLPDDRVEAEKLVGNKRNLTPTDVLLKLWARTGVFIGNYIGWGKDNSTPDTKVKQGPHQTSSAIHLYGYL